MEGKNCSHYYVDLDGFSVCTKCGITENSLVFDNDIVLTTNTNIEKTTTNQIIDELFSRNVINTQVKNDCLYFLKKWNDENIPYKKYHDAYSVYYSSKKNNFPISLKEISFYFQTSIKDFCKCEKYIRNDFDTTPYDFLEKFCKLLGLTFMDEKLIRDYLKKNYTTSERNPSHITAAAISLVFPKIPKKDLCCVTLVSPGTINKITKELRAGKFV
jgi:transcription initiation factor TFIIIB Brf1 subunit/transcription initiation factor TFIIB